MYGYKITLIYLCLSRDGVYNNNTVFPHLEGFIATILCGKYYSVQIKLCDDAYQGWSDDVYNANERAKWTGLV